MWLGTLDGVCRYDGYRLLSFRSDVNNPDLLTNNEITCFAEDGDGRIWIGTRKGINILDKTNYQISHLDDKSTFDAEIRCILKDREGYIWVGTSREILRYGSNLERCNAFENRILSSINSIFEDNKGEIFIASWANGLFHYDKRKHAFVKLPPIGKENNPFKLYQDQAGNYWVCTWGDGLFLLNKDTNGRFFYTRPQAEAFSFDIIDKRLFSITQDATYGYLWVVSFLGISVFEQGKDGALRMVDTSSLFKTTNRIFSEIMKDRTGNLWIGTFSEGVFTVNFDKPTVANYDLCQIKEKTGLTPSVTAVYADSDGDLWVNQNRFGLAVYLMKKDRVKLYTEFPALKAIMGKSTAVAISGFRSIPGVVWIGLEHRPFIYALKKRNGDISIEQIIDLNRIEQGLGNPVSFYEDRKNNIWIITTSKVLVKPYNSDKLIPLDLPIPTVSGITEDTKGGIWLNTLENGVYQIAFPGNQLNKAQPTRLLSDRIGDKVGTMYADLNGRIWFGTGGDLVTYPYGEE